MRGGVCFNPDTMTTIRNILFLLFCSLTGLMAQSTLVPSGPSDSFNLSCPGCVTKVIQTAVVKGSSPFPLNLLRPPERNLLHWQYFDSIANERVISEVRPVWAPDRVQLLSLIDDTDPISLHINLIVADSSGQDIEVFLLVSGITRRHLASLSLESFHDLDTYAPFRFTALFNPPPTDRETHRPTYEAVEGTCFLDYFHPENNHFSGSFDAVTERIGMAKKAWFLNGRFKNEP